MKRALVFAILLVLFLGIAKAQVSKYGVDVSLSQEGAAKVRTDITFEDASTKQFSFYVFAKVKNLEYSTTGKRIDCSLKTDIATLISCNFELTPDGRTITLSYTTNSFVKAAEGKSLFNADFSLPSKIGEAFIVLRLPQGMVLSSDKSYFPSDGKLSSDGKHIIIIWRYNNLAETQPLVFKAFYESSNKINFVPYLLALLFVAFFGYVFYAKHAKRSAELVTKVLDHYEKAVYEIVKREKKVKQRKIVELTSFSKARVSRIIKRLKERGLIRVEKRGRTNIIEIA